MLWTELHYPCMHVYRELYKRITVVKLAGLPTGVCTPHLVLFPWRPWWLGTTARRLAIVCLADIIYAFEFFFCQRHWALCGSKNKYTKWREEHNPSITVSLPLDDTSMFSKGWIPVLCLTHILIDSWQPQMELESRWLPLWKRRNMMSIVIT